MLRERTVVTLGLGAAVVLSLLSVCCGLGFFTTPWFMCELFAVQLALCTGQAIVRDRAFVSAAAILLVAVLMVSAVAVITLLGSGPGLHALDAFRPQGVGLDGFDVVLKRGGLAALISSVVALLMAAPFLYAPLILIEQRSQLERAIVESVRLLVAHGALASVRLSLCAHALQAAPLIVATGLALVLDPSQFALFALASTPLLCATVPLGQGMIAFRYAQLRQPLMAASTARPLALRYARAWLLLLVLPVASLLLLELSLWRPSNVPAGVAPPGELLAQLLPRESSGVRDATQRVLLPTTALEVAANPRQVRIAASDGGGVGELPLSAAQPIERVRIVRLRDAFAVELQQGAKSYVTFVDRAGVRLDDDLRARLLDRVSPLQLLLFLCTLLLTGVASVPVLYALGSVERSQQGAEDTRPSPSALAELEARSLRRARIAAAVLVPLSLACLALSLRALLGA